MYNEQLEKLIDIALMDGEITEKEKQILFKKAELLGIDVVYSTGTAKVGLDIGTADTPEDVSTTLQILLLMTILSLAPSILIMTTSYLRLIIVFHFLKTALGTQSMPPSQLLAGIALFITFFIIGGFAFQRVFFIAACKIVWKKTTGSGQDSTFGINTCNIPVNF